MSMTDRQNAFSGTREVAERLRFDAAQLETYLRDHVADFSGPLTVRQFKGGQSNPTYLVETPRAALRAATKAARQASALGACRRPRIPGDAARSMRRAFRCAEPILYCADDGIIGTAFFVMAYVEGRVFWEPHMPEADPAERAAGL